MLNALRALSISSKVGSLTNFIDWGHELPLKYFLDFLQMFPDANLLWADFFTRSTFDAG